MDFVSLKMINNSNDDSHRVKRGREVNSNWIAHRNTVIEYLICKYIDTNNFISIIFHSNPHHATLFIPTPIFRLSEYLIKYVGFYVKFTCISNMWIIQILKSDFNIGYRFSSKMNQHFEHLRFQLTPFTIQKITIRLCMHTSGTGIKFGSIYIPSFSLSFYLKKNLVFSVTKTTPKINTPFYTIVYIWATQNSV